MNDSSIDSFKGFIALGFILLAGFFLRVLLLNTYCFMPENHTLYDFTVVRNILETGSLFYDGRMSSVANFRYSALYHFFIIPVFYLFENEFTGMMIFTLLMNFSSIIIFIYIGFRCIKKPFYYLFVILMGFSFYEITELLTLWALNVLPFFTALSFMALLKIVVDGKSKWLLCLGISLGCMVQLHVVGYVFLSYAVFILFKYRKAINVLYLCLSVFLFAAVFFTFTLNQPEVLTTNYVSLFKSAVTGIFNTAKYNVVSKHMPMEYFNASVYFLGILALIFKKSSNKVFVSDNVFELFRIYACFAFVFLFFFAGDIFHIYLYRGFNFIAFAGIIFILENFKKRYFAIIYLYAFLSVSFVIVMSCLSNAFFVDFRDRTRAMEFLETTSSNYENTYLLSGDYRDEVVVGWYKYIGNKKALSASDQDTTWVIAEGESRRDVVVDCLKEQPVCSFGSVYLFQIKSEQVKENKGKLKSFSYKLYGLKDFDYSLREIEYLWKY